MNPFIICNQRRSKKTTFNDELFEPNNEDSVILPQLERNVRLQEISCITMNALCLNYKSS